VPLALLLLTVGGAAAAVVATDACAADVVAAVPVAASDVVAAVPVAAVAAAAAAAATACMYSNQVRQRRVVMLSEVEPSCISALLPSWQRMLCAVQAFISATMLSSTWQTAWRQLQSSCWDTVLQLLARTCRWDTCCW
jgi:hypothetical protein